MTTTRKRKAKRGAVARSGPKIDLAREVEIIAREFQRLHDDLQRAIERGIDRAVALGKRLARCKKAAGHGNWLKEWVPALPFSHDKASHLIRLYELSEHADPIKFRNVAKYASVTALSFLSVEGLDQIDQEIKSGKFQYLTVRTAIKRSKPQEFVITRQRDPETGEMHAEVRRLPAPSAGAGPSDAEKQSPPAVPTEPPQSPSPPEQPLQLAAPAEPKHAAGSEPQPAAPPGASTAAFFETLGNLIDLIPPYRTVSTLAAGYRDQIRVHVDDIGALGLMFTELRARLRDEATPPEGSGRKH